MTCASSRPPLPVRTVRYYIQMGGWTSIGRKALVRTIVQRPCEQLLRYSGLSEAGVSLEAIKGVLRGIATRWQSKPAAPGTVVVTPVMCCWAQALSCLSHPADAFL